MNDWTTEAPTEAGLYYAETIDGDVLGISAEEMEGNWGKIRLRWRTVRVAADEFRRFLRIPSADSLMALERMLKAALTIEQTIEVCFAQIRNGNIKDETKKFIDEWEREKTEFQASMEEVRAKNLISYSQGSPCPK